MVSAVRSRPAGRRVTVVQVVGLLLAFLLMSGVGGVLAAGLVMPAVATSSVLTDTSVRLFDDLPTELDQVPLSERSTILAADGTLLATFFFQNRVVVPLDGISQDMRDAVIAVEDQRFYEHGGIDPTGLMRAVVKNLTGQSSEGGSTLTQQYVKNALIQAALEGEDPEAIAAAIAEATAATGTEGYQRKLEEAKLAIALEQRLTKDEILERYLNIAQFGLSVYGVEAAAQYYFSVPASEVDYLQAATIAGITQRPGDFDPIKNPEDSEGRRNIVLRLMRQQSMITEAEYQEGLATSLEESLNPGQIQQTCIAANAVANAGYFCDYVTKIIGNNEAFGETRNDRGRLLYRGGLTITTTLDPDLQAYADAEVKRGIPVDDPSGVASAISVVEPGTGHVLAMAQNRIFNAAEDAGPGETAVNYNTDSAYGSSTGFAPGSTFKPFTLAQWLKEGRALNEVIDARKMEYEMSEFEASCVGFDSRTYRFGNAEGAAGIMTVMDATRRSVNSGYMAMASQLDLCGIIDTASALGVHRPSGEPFQVLPANVLGSDEVAPLTMAASFAAFAADGVYCEPIAITSVVDTDGNELEVPSANCRQAIGPEIAAGVTHALSQVWQGTASRVGGLPGQPSAGKTGTTTRNEHTWFVGYTPQLSTAVWVGFAEGMIPVQRLTINGTPYRNVYGSTIAAPTWKRFMVRAHEGLPVENFTQAGSRQIYGVQVQVPNVSGRTVGDAMAILRQAGFNVSEGTREYSDSVPEGRVTRTQPGAGSTQTRGSLITIITSRGPEPRPEPEPEPERPRPPDPPPPDNGGGGGGGGGD